MRAWIFAALLLGALLLAGLLWRTRREPGTPAGEPVDPSQGVVFLGVSRDPAAPIRNETVPRPPREEKEPAPSATGEPAPEPPVPPAVPPPGDVVIRVARGDSLWGLVQKAYGTATPDLIVRVARLNHLEDPGALKAGQALRLPYLEGFPPPQGR